MSSPQPFPSSRDPLEGTRYRTVGLLGSGGMGQVYLVEHTGLGKRFVAKVLHERLSKDPQLLERIRIEAQALGQLRHPNIVSATTFGKTVDGRPYIIMEYLQGRTLREELVARGRLPLLEAVTYACELLAALGAAHAIGIVHRDIKPDNLFLYEVPNAPRTLKVLDFGVARVTQSSPVPALTPELATESGIVIGTPRWQSPEGAMGRPVDARADVYAAALVLYVMLAGRGPFDHFQSDSLVLSAHALEDAEPPSKYSVAPLPAELDAAVLRALSKDPDQRFQSAEEFRGVLDRVAQLLLAPASSRVVFKSAVQSRPAPAPEGQRPRSDVVAPEPAATPSLAPTPYAKPARAGFGRPALLVVLVFVVSGLVTAGLVAKILLGSS
jgi:serine/threonine protein kinase